MHFYLYRVTSTRGVGMSSCKDSCPRGTSATPVDAGSGLVLCMCGVSQTWFNRGPGSVKLDFQEQLNFLNNHKLKYTVLWFRCGNFNGLDEMPAWKLDAMVGNNEPTGSNPPSKQWMVGFIQTVERLEWEGTYSAGWNRKTQAVKARDFGLSTVAPPWYGPPGSVGEPVLVADAGKNHPQLEDDPQIQLLVAHPDAPCQMLESVTVKGKFHLWLVARDPAGPLDMGHLRFLWHASITVDKAWKLTPGDDPFLLPNWKATGTQTITNEGPGQGKEIPILNQPVANDELQKIITEKKGKPCP